MRTRVTLLATTLSVFFIVAACTGGSGLDVADLTVELQPTSSPTVRPQSDSRAYQDATELPAVKPARALEVSLEVVSGFEVSSVAFRGSDVIVKYEQIVNEPSELLLVRWIEFASIAVSYLDDPLGQIIIVPIVERREIATVSLRAVDVVDYLDGKRSLEDLLASVVIE